MKHPFSLLAAVLTWIVTSIHAQAFDPTVSNVHPRGIQVGTQATFHIYGERLEDAEEIILYRAGIEILSLKNESDKHLSGELRITTDAPLGEHPFRIRTKTGVSYLHLFWVQAYPTIKEETIIPNKRRPRQKGETNNSFETPQPVELNQVIHGTARKEDLDYYHFSGKKGQFITAEVFGMRLGKTFLDPYLAILDGNNKELATSDDTVLTRRDPFISLRLPADGEYTVLVREASYNGGPYLHYLLQLSESPRPTSVHPPVAQPGQTQEFTFRSSSEEFKQTITLSTETGKVPLYAERNNHRAPSPNFIWVTENQPTPEREPNDQPKDISTQSSSLPATFYGQLDKTGDVDCFSFAAKKGQHIRIQVQARSLRSPIDALIQVKKAKSRKNLGRTDDNGISPDPKLEFTAPANDNYLLFIHDHLKRGGPDFNYVIEVTTREPRIRAELPYGINNDSQKHRVIVVPRGNHIAIAPNVSRIHTNCDVILQHDRLPKGVTLKSKRATRRPANFPILFSAAPNAPLGSTLTTFRIKDPTSNLSGPFDENIHHIEVNNTGAFCTTHNERLTVAVVEEAPFELTITPPTTPLVLSGTLSLVVTAKRKEGFTAPIKVKVPWRPSGIGVPTEVTIPKDQNKITLSLNAGSETPLGESPFCITGSAHSGNGEIRVSSPFVPIKVTAPYLEGSIDLATTPQGKDITLICELEHLKPFQGNAELTLHALPHNVTAQPVRIKAGEKTVKIPLKISADVKPGKNKGIFAQVAVKQGPDTILHQIATNTTLIITPKKK